MQIYDNCVCNQVTNIVMCIETLKPHPQGDHVYINGA